jgi:hypothetical protein
MRDLPIECKWEITSTRLEGVVHCVAASSDRRSNAVSALET